MNTRGLKSSSVESVFISALLVAVLLVTSGCLRKTPEISPTEQQLSTLTHTVKAQGETLFAIAAWYTGQGLNWKLLVEANPGLNPNKMRIGEVIRIPRNLAKRVEPMPVPSAKRNPVARSQEPSRGDSDSDPQPATGSSDPRSMDTGSTASESSAGEKLDDDFADVQPLTEPFPRVVAPQPTVGSVRVTTETGFSRSSLADPASVVTSASAASSAPASVDSGVLPEIEPTAIVEKRTKSRDELLQELLKDY